MVEKYSGWPSVYYYPKTTATSKGLIDALRSWFMQNGVPEEISLDGQSTYTSQVKKRLPTGMGGQTQIIFNILPPFQYQSRIGGEGDEEVDEGQHWTQG